MSRGQTRGGLVEDRDRTALAQADNGIVRRRVDDPESRDRKTSAEWGPGVFGAEAAAQYYYSKAASDLSEREAALMAVALPNPIYGNWTANPQN